MSNNFPVSLRSWPSDDSSANSLSTLIGRINNERGNFREISEESLLKEAQTSESEQLEIGQDDSSGEEDEETPDRMKELMKARVDILGQIEGAVQASMIAQDFISLLLSKDTPVQASLSISPLLKEAVGMGTISTDLVQSSRLTEAQRAVNRETVKGWKVQSLNQTVDSILASATRLQKGIEAETKYWEQVLAIVGKGWDVAKLPQERHTLGVRIGFAECTPAFKNRTLAALRSNADGSITLDQGFVDSRAKRVRVRIKTDGKITGSQQVPAAPSETAPIEDLILEARNTIFNEELWQEMNREARYLVNQGVCAKGGEISCEMTATKSLIFDLVSLDESFDKPQGSSQDNLVAEGVSLALQLLLSWAHRQNFRRRTQPPPALTGGKRPTPAYSLIRPILTRLQYESTVAQLHSLFIPLCGTLQCAGYTSASYSMLPRSGVEQGHHAQQVEKSASEVVIETLVQQLDSDIDLQMTGEYKFKVKSRTAIYSFIMTQFRVEPPRVTMSEDWQPPPRVANLEELRDYLLHAISCCISTGFVSAPPSTQKPGTESPNQGPEPEVETDIAAPGTTGWLRTTQNNVLRKTFSGTGHSRQLVFTMDSPGTLRVESFELNGEGKELRNNEWTWHSDGRGPKSHDGGPKVLKDVVEEAGTWKGEAADIDTSVAATLS